MDQAVEHTGLAVDPARQEALLQQIGALYNTAKLIDADPRVPWESEDQLATDHHHVPARPALPPALARLVEDEDEDIEVLDTTPQVMDTAQRAALMRAAREYWDRQIAKRIVPRTVDIAQEIGISLATARSTARCGSSNRRRTR
ncbi:hypothetical protein [Nonomuraea recticatena]|uniref:hypothetical protein n=1 Tax=Nonomuraea recticatena TaxID=46178 RepID=UPI003620D57F